MPRVRKQLKKYRSKFEQKIADQLEQNKIAFEYEKVKLRWVDPAKNRVYTPDYRIANGIIIECKGFFKPQDRLKMLEVIKQYPDLDIRMVFQDAHKKINKGSSTTYADWCEKYNIKYSHKEIPEEWLFEDTSNTRQPCHTDN